MLKFVCTKLCFTRNWTEYSNGFGDITANYWMGLDKMSRITSQGPVQLLVYLEAADGFWEHAMYDSFQIASSDDNFRLSISGYIGGNAGDSLINEHNGRQFST